MLDTNIASDIIRGNAKVRARLLAVPMQSVAVSAVTQAELLYGVAKRGNPVGLNTQVREFLVRVEVLAWTPEVAASYAILRAAWEQAGISLAPMDMMIAAHAVSVHATLVTRDRAFSFVPHGLTVENWAA